eukprot:2806-Heterococcus_DN1.PRE.1
MPERVAYDSASTLYSAAVASPSTARLAHSSGLAIGENKQLHLIAGLCADIETLTALRELGMLLSETLVTAVAFSGRLHILQHLLTEEQCPQPESLSYFGAFSGSTSMLVWLRAQGWCVFDAKTCAGAAQGGHLAALKHLRSDGCEWDDEYIACDAATSGSTKMMKWLQQPQQGVQIRSR